VILKENISRRKFNTRTELSMTKRIFAVICFRKCLKV
ncbi:hypothetical protein, partial [Plasmodium yoelii yoelii]